MNVRKLKALLEGYPDDMEIVNQRMSDHQLVEAGDFSIIKGVPQQDDGWIMRAHETMSAENHANCRQYLCIKGN